ncbi:MAG: FHA domain-containing protein [Woeseiaceae bacterium]|nr:FHA domain-containing protein [Woeseiaceae bacterium]
MQANYSVLGGRAFGEDADNLTVIKYRSHHEALQFLQSALRNPNGIGLVHGPAGSGKSTVARELALQVSIDSDVAFVDGRQLKPNGLLTKMVNQFGIESTADADDELLRVVTEFANEQTRSWQAPVLIIDNVDRMYPSTLRILNTLAALAIQGRYSLRLALTGDKTMQTLVESDGMTSLIQRDPVTHSLLPLSSKETMIYLHARMQAAGSERSDTIFPFDVCDRLREQSGGWPGQLNRFALEAIKRSDGFPVSVDSTYAPGETADTGEQIPVLGKKEAVTRMPPKLIVTRDGDTLGEYAFKDNKLLIGRSDFADVMVDDDYVSKIHAVLLLYSDALVLLDLNSANGTTVNSVKVKKTILKDGDIISLGNHRVKIENAPVISADVEELLKAPDTIKMKNLVDLRRQRARRRMLGKKNRSG